MLVSARVRLGVSQAELAERAVVSLAAVKAYEQGKRHPSRPYLVALLDALKLPVMERNAILVGAGYASDVLEIVPDQLDMDFTPSAAQAELDRLAWPSFVLNDALEVVLYNHCVEQLWDVDIVREYPNVADRSMLSVATDPRYADRVLNWEEAVGTMAAVFKGHYRGGEDLETPSPAFAAILARLLAGDPRYVARFLKIWQDIAPAPLLLRWHYRIVWDVPAIGPIELDCIVSHCNRERAWAFNDWIPVGAGSWANLTALLDRDRRR